MLLARADEGDRIEHDLCGSFDAVHESAAPSGVFEPCKRISCGLSWQVKNFELANCSRSTSGRNIARFGLPRQRMRFTIGTGFWKRQTRMWCHRR